MGTGSWITQDRETRVYFDAPTYLVVRPPWSLRRRGSQIHRGQTEAAVTENVAFQPGEAWTLRTTGDDLTKVIHTAEAGQVLGAADVHLGIHWTAVDTFRNPSDLPGLDPSGVLLSPAGVPAFTKRVARAADWDSDLAADSAAYPKPVLPSADIPMDRVLISKETYPANRGFALLFSTPGDYNGADTLATFYLGGPREGTPAGALGGEYCLSVRGSGELLLKEKTGPAEADWAARSSLPWAQSGRAGNLRFYALRVFPYGRDSLALSAGEVDAAAGTGGFTFGGNLLPTLAGFLTRNASRAAGFYRNSPILTGVRPRYHMTGPGPVRLDFRRDLRTYAQLIRLAPVETGTLVDLPFWIPFPVPDESSLIVTVDGYNPPNSDPETEQARITVRMFNAVTHAELDDVPGHPTGFEFLSQAGQQAYYVVFDFAADELAEQTPVLYGYHVEVGGEFSTRTPSPTSFYPRSVSITGPDVTPDQDTASVRLEDPTNALSLLRTRARMPTQIRIHNRNTGTLVSVLFEGELARAVAKKKGVTGKTYPSPNWRAYDVSLVGVWARLAAQVNLDPMYFDVDPTAPEDPLWGGQPPWKITDIIATLLEKCGFPAAARDIPDLPIRLWPSGARTEDEFRVQPTASLAEFIQKLAREYLGMVLCWDPNAGTAGMWRLLANPQAPYNVVAHFREGPASANKLGMHPGSYGTGVAPIIFGTYDSFVRPPECNYVLVVGADMTAPTEVGPAQTAFSLYNAASFDFVGATSDDTSPDYLGFFAPVIHCDPTLRTQEACAWVARRIYDFAAHGQKWVTFDSPLLLITDSLDTQQVRSRPVRINDAVYVTVGGSTGTFLVRSCNPNYRHDGAQIQTVEAVQVA